MKKILSILVLVTISLSVNAQHEDYWKSWDDNYRTADVIKIVNSETAYADSVNKGLIKGDSYSRISKYKVKGIRAGQQRAISPELKQTIAAVFKVYNVDTKFLDMVEYEVLMECDGKQVWMPIQTSLINPFKKEIPKGTESYLYCLFVNAHHQKELTNVFIISEFAKEQ